jgi:hypothetical protein
MALVWCTSDLPSLLRREGPKHIYVIDVTNVVHREQQVREVEHQCTRQEPYISTVNIGKQMHLKLAP